MLVHPERELTLSRYLLGRYRTYIRPDVADHHYSLLSPPVGPLRVGTNVSAADGLSGRCGELKLLAELLVVSVALDVSAVRLLVDELSSPPCQVAQRELQQIGRSIVPVQRDVGGYSLC